MSTRPRQTIRNVAIFRAGDYGEKGTYTPADLQQMADAYNSGKHIAPVTIDHTQSGPKWGEVLPGTVKARGNLLFADVAIDPEFMPLVKRGAYDQRSIELYRNQTPEGEKSPGRVYLRALTFLGAQPPEVKGLPAIQMSEQNAVFIEFSEESNEGLPAVPPEINLAIEAAVARALELQSKGHQTMTAEETIAAKDAEIEALKAKIAAMESEEMEEGAAEEALVAPAPVADEKDAELAALKAEMAEYKRKMQMAEAKAFSESIKALKLPAPVTDCLTSIRNASGDVVKFSDKTESSRDEALLELARRVAGIASVVTGQTITTGENQAAFSEGRAANTPDKHNKALTAKAAALAKAEGIEFSEALFRTLQISKK
jgi:hypothetical protein